MILKAARLVRSLSRRQYAMIVITIVIPALIFLLPSSITGGPVWVAVIYIGWIAVVVLSVASMLEEDRSKAQQSVDRKLKILSTEVQRLKDVHSQTTAGLKDQVTEIDSVMRSTFEQMGVVLPPSTISLRASFSAGAAQMSATLTVVGESRMTRFRHWVQRHALQFWRWFYG